MDTIVRLLRAYAEHLAARQARYNELAGQMPHVDSPVSVVAENTHRKIVCQLDEEQAETPNASNQPRSDSE